MCCQQKHQIHSKGGGEKNREIEEMMNFFWQDCKRLEHFYFLQIAGGTKKKVYKMDLSLSG